MNSRPLNERVISVVKQLTSVLTIIYHAFNSSDTFTVWHEYRASLKAKRALAQCSEALKAALTNPDTGRFDKDAANKWKGIVLGLFAQVTELVQRKRSKYDLREIRAYLADHESMLKALEQLDFAALAEAQKEFFAHENLREEGVGYSEMHAGASQAYSMKYLSAAQERLKNEKSQHEQGKKNYHDALDVYADSRYKDAWPLLLEGMRLGNVRCYLQAARMLIEGRACLPDYRAALDLVTFGYLSADTRHLRAALLDVAYQACDKFLESNCESVVADPDYELGRELQAVLPQMRDYMKGFYGEDGHMKHRAYLELAGNLYRHANSAHKPEVESQANFMKLLLETYCVGHARYLGLLSAKVSKHNALKMAAQLRAQSQRKPSMFELDGASVSKAALFFEVEHHKALGAMNGEFTSLLRDLSIPDDHKLYIKDFWGARGVMFESEAKKALCVVLKK